MIRLEAFLDDAPRHWWFVPALPVLVPLMMVTLVWWVVAR